jgi:hypothetical protein
MVQIFDLSPTDSSGSLLGKAAAMGLARNYPQPEQVVQRGLLEQAMTKLPQNASPIDMIKTIGPQLLTTPGGAQLLGELAPLLQKTTSNKILADYYDKQINELNKVQSSQTSGQPQISPQEQMPQTSPDISTSTGKKPFGQQYFSRPTPPVSEESTYPKMSAMPQKRAMMTPEQEQLKRLQLLQSYAQQGLPADPVAIQNAIENEKQSILNYNQQIDTEAQNREAKQARQTAEAMNRFEQSAQVPKSDEDKFVFERFANEARDAANPNDQYNYAKAKYKQYDNAREGILRDAGNPNFLTKVFRKTIGTFKEKNAMMKELYPNVKKLIDLGLEDQARALLSDGVGLGKEDTELTMFPFSNEETKLLNTLPPNPRMESYLKEGKGKDRPKYPGEDLALAENEFSRFKESIANFLERFPDTNIVALRGLVNQDKGYAWTDYSKALAELIDEGRVNPNNYQEQQWNVVKSPPVEGLGGMFRLLWEGTK